MANLYIRVPIKLDKTLVENNINNLSTTVTTTYNDLGNYSGQSVNLITRDNSTLVECKYLHYLSSDYYGETVIYTLNGNYYEATRIWSGPSTNFELSALPYSAQNVTINKNGTNYLDFVYEFDTVTYDNTNDATWNAMGVLISTQPLPAVNNSAEKYLNKSGLSYFWNKLKALINNKLDNDAIATDNAYGIIKLNSSEGITLTQNGNLDVTGRLGQMSNTTGVYSPKSISPAEVGNGSFLLTEASGTKLGNKSLAVSTGSNLTLKTSAAAGSTQYVVTNSYANRIICAGAVGGTVALNESSSSTSYATVTSVQINGSSFTPDSSRDSSTNNIIITVDKSVNPNSSTSQIRLYFDEAGGGFSNLFVGQAVGGKGGASVIVGQKVYSNSGNACAMIGADIYNSGNGNALFGRQHISKKNRWFMSGTGHDNTDGKSESGAVLGQWSNITANTAFAIGNGTSATVRKNLFEILNDGTLVLISPNGSKFKFNVTNDGDLTTTSESGVVKTFTPGGSYEDGNSMEF